MLFKFVGVWKGEWSVGQQSKYFTCFPFCFLGTCADCIDFNTCDCNAIDQNLWCLKYSFIPLARGITSPQNSQLCAQISGKCFNRSPHLPNILMVVTKGAVTFINFISTDFSHEVEIGKRLKVKPLESGRALVAPVDPIFPPPFLPGENVSFVQCALKSVRIYEVKVS